MSTHNVDIESRWVNALRTQSKIEPNFTGPFPCPYGHQGRIFQNIEQLWAHTKAEHATQIVNMETTQARTLVRDLALKLRRSDQSLDATAGGRSTPDITSLSLDPGKERKSPPHPSKKRRADSDFNTRRKAPTHVEVVDPAFSRDIPHTIVVDQIRPKSQEPRLFDPKKVTRRIASPHKSTKVDTGVEKQPSKPADPQTPEGLSRRPGLIELPKYDSRYPGLLLQPDSRPISQEQLASEVKSIYAGLTMVETKCIDVDKSLAHARQAKTGQVLSSEHWQALIALHRTLLHEHHDFFLASQHPSASPALRRLAAKYSMPGRMWRIGIHPFLEELRLRLSDKEDDPSDTRDHMMAFIYMTYQMVALLYETVPAFEYTWIECLGDLGRYRMAIEKDAREHEAWAGVSRSWYSKATDKTPTVGRLSHHLAILARSNGLQQMYYYSKSLASVEPFEGARRSITGTMDTARGCADVPTYSHALPIDESFIRAHACLFEKDEKKDHEAVQLDFTEQLDNHIGRMTAMWKDQGAYVAVTNIAAWFDYGKELSILREVFLNRLSHLVPQESPSVTQPSAPASGHQRYPVPTITERDIPAGLSVLESDSFFSKVKRLTFDTFSLVLRRIGDKNVLPHVHIMLSFFSSLASSENVAHLIDYAPWAELATFLNTLIKTEIQQNKIQNISAVLTKPVFPTGGNNDRGDELPLPEDYMIRGLIWAPTYFTLNWFEREIDEEERYLELASTTRSRMERILRLGFQISSLGRWLSYNTDSHTFASIVS